jgi:hypothetical protein
MTSIGEEEKGKNEFVGRENFLGESERREENVVYGC